MKRTVMAGLLIVMALVVAVGSSGVNRLAPMAAAQENPPDAVPENPPMVMPSGLPDFSWAGYRMGTVAPPTLDATLDITDFGAVSLDADASSDATEALRQAIAAAEAKNGGVIRIPAGRWKLSAPLTISGDNVVLQGAGSGNTTIFVPHSLSDLLGYSPSWSWSGGFFVVRPPHGPTSRVGTVTAVTPAGGTELTVTLAAGTTVEPGEWLELNWHNDTGTNSLLDHLYGGVIPHRQIGREMIESTAARVREWIYVTAVTSAPTGDNGGGETPDAGGDGDAENEDGATQEKPEPLPGSDVVVVLTIAQPLRLDVRPEWRPELLRRPTITEVGIEGMTIEFPETPYPGHLKERGYNAITITNGINCWVRDLQTVFADSGIFIGPGRYITVDRFRARGRTMHHPVCISWGADCLVTNWRIDAPHIHGTTISWGAHGNVFSRGFGHQLKMDAHGAVNFMNLHTNVAIYHGSRPINPFQSGGSAPRRPHSARQNVYWNIRNEFAQPSESPATIGPVREWPLGTFVGWHGNRPLRFEPIASLRQQVVALNTVPAIPDLHRYQRARRLGR